MQLGVIFFKHLFDSQQNQRQFVEAYYSIEDIDRQIDRQIDIVPQLTQHMKSFGYFGCYKIQWCSLPMPLQSIVTPYVPFKLLIIMNFTKDEANQDQLYIFWIPSFQGFVLLISIASQVQLANIFTNTRPSKHFHNLVSKLK